jgi:hypothetical protein
MVTHSKKPLRDHTQPNLVQKKRKLQYMKKHVLKISYTQKRLTTQDGAKEINIASRWSS